MLITSYLLNCITTTSCHTSQAPTRLSRQCGQVRSRCRIVCLLTRLSSRATASGCNLGWKSCSARGNRSWPQGCRRLVYNNLKDAVPGMAGVNGGVKAGGGRFSAKGPDRRLQGFDWQVLSSRMLCHNNFQTRSSSRALCTSICTHFLTLPRCLLPVTADMESGSGPRFLKTHLLQPHPASPNPPHSRQSHAYPDLPPAVPHTVQ